MEYTTQSDNIYFLNDKNIATGVELTCKAGFNAVPSQQTFVTKYGELSAYDEGLSSYVKNTVEPGIAGVSQKVDGLSNVYLKLSGGALTGKLTVPTVEVTQKLDADKINAGGLSAAGAVIDGNMTVSPYNGHGTVEFKLEHGLDDIYAGTGDSRKSIAQSIAAGVESANGYTDTAKAEITELIETSAQQLMSYADNTADNKIDAKTASLSVDAVTAVTGMMVGTVGQRNGIVTISTRQIISDDIPCLPQEKIHGLTSDYATNIKVDNLSGTADAKFVHANHIRIERLESDKSKIALIDDEHDISSVVDCSDFIKDGMIDTVEYDTIGDASHAVPPYIKITWNSAAGKTATWLQIRDFANIYTVKPGENGVSIDNFEISLNWNEIAKKNNVDNIQSYVHSLSVENTGVIDTLSSGIDALTKTNVSQLKFDGHIDVAAEGDTLKNILEKCGVEGSVPNNAAYFVKFKIESQADRAYSFTTADGFTIGNGDIVIIHEHDTSIKTIRLTDLTADNVIIVKAGTSSYELYSHLNDVDNPHNVTAHQTSAYLCSETSSSVELENKFNTLSTYDEIHNQLSSDGYVIDSDLTAKVSISGDAMTGPLSVRTGNKVVSYSANNITLSVNNGSSSQWNYPTAVSGTIALCSDVSAATKLTPVFGEWSFETDDPDVAWSAVPVRDSEYKIIGWTFFNGTAVFEIENDTDITASHTYFKYIEGSEVEYHVTATRSIVGYKIGTQDITLLPDTVLSTDVNGNPVDYRLSGILSSYVKKSDIWNELTAVHKFNEMILSSSTYYQAATTHLEDVVSSVIDITNLLMKISNHTSNDINI